MSIFLKSVEKIQISLKSDKNNGYKSWTFCGGRIQLNFLGQIAASRYEGFPTFRNVTSSPSSGYVGGLVAPKLLTRFPTLRCVYFKSPDLVLPNPEDGDGASYGNVGKPSHLDAVVCSSKFHRRITGILHEDVCTFTVIIRWILLRMENISDKRCKENQNAHFKFNNVFPKIVSFTR
jgi:hypothetical protein